MNPRQFALLVLLAALWGASFLFMRIAGPEFGPFALIAVRVTLASVVLLPIWFWREPRGGRRAVIEHWRGLVVIGLLNSAIPFVLFAYSTLFITGGLAAIMNSTATIWTAVVAWVWLRRRPGLRTSMGLFLGLLGVIVLVSDSITGGVSGAGKGAFAAAFAALLYGIAANYAAERLPGVSSLSIATFSLVAASFALIPIALIFMPTTTISTQAWAAVIAMGIFSTAVANIIYFHLLGAIGSTRAVTVTFLIPVFGTVWGAMFIDEAITPVMLVGGAIIFSGLALVTQLVPRSFVERFMIRNPR
jgi:drug/metabolite transporter (DMT)-like permease